MILILFLAFMAWRMSGFPGCRPGKPAAVSGDDIDRYNGQTFSCVKVLDGDTVHIGLSDPKAKKPQAYTIIRLWGIDTPEISHFGKPTMYYGYEAAAFARKLMAGKPLRLELVPGYTRDKFGRLLAYIYLPDGRMYNALALDQGYAYAETRFKHPRKKEFLDREARARDAYLGLWAGVKPADLPHWYPPSRLSDFWEERAAEKKQSREPVNEGAE